MRQASQAAARDETAAAFEVAVAELRSGQEQVRALRPELVFEDIPAPRTLAPYASAVEAVVDDGEEDEAASGRFMLLFDPASQRGWEGPLRVVVLVRAELEAEIAADPLLGQVAWSWLTDELAGRVPGYTAESGTVTRVVTEGFGGKSADPARCGVELRASWTPAMPGGAGQPGLPDAAWLAGIGLAEHLAAWCGALCAASGLPPLAAGVAPLRPPAGRRAR